MKSWRWIAALAMPLSYSVSAAWISADDVYLRADIQSLADAGVISVPINTYPLMWVGIIEDLQRHQAQSLSPALQARLQRVLAAYQQQTSQTNHYQLEFIAASEGNRFQGFGADYREPFALRASGQYVTDDLQVKLSGVVNNEPIDGKTARAEESYIAKRWGNWWLTLGKLDQWWGPGLDTGLMRTTNADPMPSLMLSRHHAQGFSSPWLSWIGPWAFSAGFSVFEQARFAPHLLLWNFRGSFKPLPQLEIGGSWTSQFCGEGQECDVDSIFRSVTGQRDCREDIGDGCSNYGNQMAGFDIRYADTLMNIPVGLYMERICEDATGSAPWDLTDCNNLLGADTHWGDSKRQYRLLFEYSSTLQACSENEDIFNCFYEHSTYLSGNRYYGQTLGSTYGSDSNAYVMGFIGQFDTQKSVKVFARYVELNEDGEHPNTTYVKPVPKEDVWMLESSYRFPALQGMLTLGGILAHQKHYEIDETNTELNVFTRYQYQF